jgi:hypothetical protein
LNAVGSEKEKGMSNPKLSAPLEDTYSIVDDIFRVFEGIKSMFKQWDRSKHMPFIQEVMKLQELESRLLQLGYQEDFTRLLVKCVYESVFTEYERASYSGNWHILA